MGVSFFEVMRGELVDRWGRRHPADFEIKAEASHMARFVATGHARITGVVSCPPWAEHAPLSGELRISTLRRREIVYEFSFTDPEDERSYQFSGRKDLRWLAPLASATRMRGRLRHAGKELAQGELAFDTNHLVNFLASWWPSSGIRPVKLRPPEDRPPAARILAPNELALLRALAEATIVPDHAVPAVDERTLDGAVEHLLAAPGVALAGYRAALRWLDVLARRERGSRFAELELDARRELLARVSDADARSGWGRLWPRSVPPDALLQLLAVPVKASHFDRRDYLDAIGHPREPRVLPEAEPRHFQRVKRPESLPAETVVHAEVAIVGTGAGGAALAAALAEQGVAVAMIEEGRYQRRHQFTGSPTARMRRLWRHAGMNLSLGTPMVLPVGKAVGGTTTINSGTCFPTPDAVLDQWRAMGFPEDFDPERYRRYSDRVARALQVGPGEAQAVGRIADVIGRGADRLGLAHGPLPRNAPGCPGRGECIFGCPEGAKRSTDVSFVPDALKAGAELYVGLPVTRILKRGRRAIAVEARGSDLHGAPKLVRVFADKIVLACGSLHTPTVLMDNGIRSPRLGRNLSVHPSIGLVARCGEDLAPWNAIPQGYGIDALADDGIRFEGFYIPPQLTALALPLWGERLGEWMADFPRLGQFGLMVRDGGDGWVRRGADGRPVIGYRLSEESQRRLRLGASLLSEVFLEAGATEVFTSISARAFVRTPGEARGLRDLATTRSDFRLLGAHPLGTCAMGADPEQGVVDFDHRVFGTDNLYVVDGSVVPTSLGVNPQMTIMAMALRAADVIAQGLV
jgi:choline dehydrogenase-like flavoprotein